MAFNIEAIPNYAGKPAILLRQVWREGKRIRKRHRTGRRPTSTWSGQEVLCERWSLTLRFTFLDAIPSELVVYTPMGLLITYL